MNDVPPSLPVIPAFANAVNPPTVSSMLRPVWFAMRPAWFSASPMSLTEPCAFAAPAARRSAMCPTFPPDRPNWFMADAAASAAAATSI